MVFDYLDYVLDYHDALHEYRGLVPDYIEAGHDYHGRMRDCQDMALDSQGMEHGARNAARDYLSGAREPLCPPRTVAETEESSPAPSMTTEAWG